MIYIYLKSNIVKLTTHNINLYDVCDIIGDVKVKNFSVKSCNEQDENYSVSPTEIYKALKGKHTHEQIEFINSDEVIVQFVKKKKSKKIIEFLKVFVVASIVFVGSLTAIMAFQIESEMGKLVERFGHILSLSENEIKYGFTIPYSLGVTLGIIIFFNHFGNKKISNDPTPIEIELVEYDEKVKRTIVSHLNEGGEN